MDLGSLQSFGLSEYHSVAKQGVGKGEITCQKLLSQNSYDFTNFVILCFDFFLISFNIFLSPLWLSLFFSSSFPTQKEVTNIKFYVVRILSEMQICMRVKEKTLLSHFSYLIQ